MHANWLLESRPEHVELSDRSAAKKQRVPNAHVEFVLC